LQTDAASGFVINLNQATSYNILVCYANITPSEVPAHGEFSEECGYCSICVLTTGKLISLWYSLINPIKNNVSAPHSLDRSALLVHHTAMVSLHH